MANLFKNRRRFIKAGLAAPLIGAFSSYTNSLAASSGSAFHVPEEIRKELISLYGNEAHHITETDRITLHAKVRYDDNWDIPVKLIGEKSYVKSFAMFYDKNPRSLVAKAKFHKGTDLQFYTRFHSMQRGTLYVVAQTANGLVGTSKKIKYFHGARSG